MTKKTLVVLILVLLLAASVLGCGAKSEEQAPSGEVALKITGGSQEMAWTESELKAMDTLDVDYTGKDGTTVTYSGVLMSALVALAGADQGATLVLVASDDYTAEIALGDVQACSNCIVAFDPEGGLRSVLPDQSGKLQVKNLVEIQVK